MGGVRLSQVRERGCGGSPGRTTPFRSMGEGQEKGKWQSFRRVCIPRERLLYRWQQGFILRGKDNSSGKVEERGDKLMDGPKAGAGRRLQVQRAGAGSAHL